jgi:hypothetical protein
MRKYYYQNAMNPKKYLNCLRTAREWINQDLPDIYRVVDNTRVVEVTFPEYKVLVYADNEVEAKQLEKFIKINTGKEPEVYY